MENKSYFVYEHRLLNGSVFYVGRGTKTQDGGMYRAYSLHNRNKYWHNITSNNMYSVHIVYGTDDINFAKAEECRLIALYGRFDLGYGLLVNLSDGGNDTGIVQSELSKEKKKRFGSDNHFYGKSHNEKSISTGRRNQPGVKPLVNSDGLSFESSTLAAIYYGVDRKAIKLCIDGKIKSGKLKGVCLSYVN